MSEQFTESTWKGQKRFHCNQTWESGGPCEFDTHDMRLMLEHIRAPHTLTGKAPKVARHQPSIIVDSEGKPIVREEPAPEFQEFRFRPEE